MYKYKYKNEIYNFKKKIFFILNYIILFFINKTNKNLLFLNGNIYIYIYLFIYN